MAQLRAVSPICEDKNKLWMQVALYVKCAQDVMIVVYNSFVPVLYLEIPC